MNAEITFNQTDADASTDTEANKFGIYEITIDDIALTHSPQEIHIMTDVSGSMDEPCIDNNTKLDQIKHVIKNMIRFIANNSTDITLRVSAFNMGVRTIIADEIVSSKNLDSMIRRVDQMVAEDQTNIEDALLSLRNSNIVSNRHNIFMSAGDANEGETDALKLARLVDTNAANTFIGFGLEHNPYMFTTLANTRNSAYYFIDQLEKSGIAYGEILHGILYRAYNNVSIVVENGEVYDWKTDTWKPEVYIGGIATDTKKSYHIRSAVELASVRVRLMCEQNVICDTGFGEKYADLTQMLYRQKTLEILYKASNMSKIYRMDMDLLRGHPTKTYNDAIRELKVEMKKLIAEMTEYMNTLDDKKLMKNLCDDIVVVYRTIGTKYGHMYSCSRQCSQGNERIHTTSNTPKQELYHTVFSAPRRYTHTQYDFDNDEFMPNGLNLDLDIIGATCDNGAFGSNGISVYGADGADNLDNYVVSGEADTPHYSKNKMALITSISETDDDVM